MDEVVEEEQTDRQTDRPTDRPTDRQIDRRTDRQTDRQTDREKLWSDRLLGPDWEDAGRPLSPHSFFLFLSLVLFYKFNFSSFPCVRCAFNGKPRSFSLASISLHASSAYWYVHNVHELCISVSGAPPGLTRSSSPRARQADGPPAAWSRHVLRGKHLCAYRWSRKLSIKVNLIRAYARNLQHFTTKTIPREGTVGMITGGRGTVTKARKQS